MESVAITGCDEGWDSLVCAVGVSIGVGYAFLKWVGRSPDRLFMQQPIK